MNLLSPVRFAFSLLCIVSQLLIAPAFGEPNSDKVNFHLSKDAQPSPLLDVCMDGVPGFKAKVGNLVKIVGVEKNDKRILAENQRVERVGNSCEHCAAGVGRPRSHRQKLTGV